MQHKALWLSISLFVGLFISCSFNFTERIDGVVLDSSNRPVASSIVGVSRSSNIGFHGSLYRGIAIQETETSIVGTFSIPSRITFFPFGIGSKQPSCLVVFKAGYLPAVVEGEAVVSIRQADATLRVRLDPIGADDRVNTLLFSGMRCMGGESYRAASRLDAAIAATRSKPNPSLE